MFVREYNKADRQRCLELFRSNMPLYFADHEYSDYEVWLDGMDARKQAYKNSQAEFYYVLENNNQLSACGGFYVTTNAVETRMCWGMVDHSFHKKGLGTMLLEYRIQKIRDLFPSTKIALDTSQHSFGFFEKLGFQVLKVTENSYAPGLHRYDMSWANDLLKGPAQP